MRGTTDHSVILNYYKQTAHIVNLIGDWQCVLVPGMLGLVGTSMNWRAEQAAAGPWEYGSASPELQFFKRRCKSSFYSTFTILSVANYSK